MAYQAIWLSPLGLLGIQMVGCALSGIDFLEATQSILPASNESARWVIKQLASYFFDPYFCFTVPYHLRGTCYQQTVWHALLSIPVGQTMTYSSLAAQLNTSPRAVGNACRANPLPIIVPCHRVVAKHKLGGYGGCLRKQALKAWLLRHEDVVSDYLK